MPSKSKVVNRKIQFFRIDVGSDEAGEPLPFDPEPVLRHLKGLPFTIEGNYWNWGGGDLSLCSVGCCDAPQRLRFGTSRRSSLPQVEENGAVSPLAISNTAGLVEWTHVMFFPNNIMGAEFNYYGPRVPRLREYLREKGPPPCENIAFHQLLRDDALQKLRRLQDIQLFRLNIHASYAETIGQIDESLADAFDALRRVGEAEQVEVIMRPPPRSRKGRLSKRLIGIAENLLQRNDLRDNTNVFRVKGTDSEIGLSEPIDLLNDQLIAHRQVMREDSRTRAIDSKSAFTAIESAYEELREDLEKAAAVGY